MNHKNQWITALVVAALAGGGVPYKARAQEDFPPPPDFGDETPPPPPPTTDFNESGRGSSRGSNAGHSANGAASGTTTGLTKNQKEKFNRSGIEDMTNQNFPETIESFDFPNVEIGDIIKTISELTGKNFIIDPGVRGKITIIAPSRITVAEAYKAFLSSLAINGYTVVPSGSFLKVKNARNAQRDSIETYSGAYYPNDDQMITRIIHLKHIQAEMVNRDLRILTSKDGEMSVYTPTNSLILSDYGSNIDRVMKIINQLDVAGFEDQIEVVRIRHAKAKDLGELIDKIVNKGQKSTTGGAPGTFTGGVPRFTRAGGGAQGGSGNSFYMAIPDERSNSMIIVGNKSGILRVKKLIAQLDFPIRIDEAGGVYVYYVKHGDAEKIAQVLQGVTKDAAPKPGAGATPGGFPSFGGFGGAQGAAASGNEIFGGDVKITADKNSNSLVVIASKQDYEKIVSLLNKIDIPRDQVFVETLITEMSMGDATDWKVAYFKFSDSGYGKAGFNGMSGNDLNALLSPQGGGGGILGFGQGKTVNVTDPSSGKAITIPNLLGFINFLKTNRRLNIMSTPQLMVLDHEQGTLEVGDRVATSFTQSAGTGGIVTKTPNMEDATLKLELKPFISPTSETIRLEIKQTIKQPGTPIGPKALQDETLPLQTRNISTNIVVNNNDTAVLGGLMKDIDNESISKVPLLGDLPIIGWLFKSRSTQRDKVNLVVFMTPKIIRTNKDASNVIGERLDERLDFIKAAGGKDPFGSKMDKVQQNITRMRGTPDAVPRDIPQEPLRFDPPQQLNQQQPQARPNVARPSTPAAPAPRQQPAVQDSNSLIQGEAPINSKPAPPPADLEDNPILTE